MLKHAEALLRELGVLDAQQTPRYFVNITTGEAMSVSAFVDARRFFQIKASEFVDLTHEYQAYRRAWTDFPEFVPQPLAHSVRAGWHIMAFEGVAHTGVAAGAVLRGEGALSEVLLDFFARARARARTGEAHAALFERIEAHLGGNPHVRAALASARAAGVLALPNIAQHSDFALNNLALGAGKLVIFDWEDYARIALPGFDLAVLVTSLAGAQDDLLRALADERTPLEPRLDAFVRRACVAAGIEFVTLRRLLPCYLSAFLYLKRNYGSTVRQRIESLLRQLAVKA